MNTKEIHSMTMEELEEFAVTLQGWTLLEGMLLRRPPSGAPDDDGDFERHCPSTYRTFHEWFPVLSDPATVALCLHLARTLSGDKKLHIVPYHTHIVGPPPTREMVDVSWYAMATEPSEYIWQGIASVLVNQEGKYMAGPQEAHAVISAIHAYGKQ